MDGEPNEKHFTELKVIPCKELVTYGLDATRGLAPKSTGTHLEPADFHKKLLEPNTVLIDVRNHYEVGIGHFAGEAELIDPLMRVSTDFPGWARSAATAQQLEGKQILMCCTGGIRCERASGVIRELAGVEMSGVYQLQGGIEKYLQVFPDGGLWQGKNFTFDKRGDVARSTTAESAVLPSLSILSICCACSKPWDVYLGKKKCAGHPSTKPGSALCGVPVLVCESCLTARVPPESLRCPLCAPPGQRAAKPAGTPAGKPAGKAAGKPSGKPAAAKPPKPAGAGSAEKGIRKPLTKEEKVAKRRKEDQRKKRRREEKRAALEAAQARRARPAPPPPPAAAEEL